MVSKRGCQDVENKASYGYPGSGHHPSLDVSQLPIRAHIDTGISSEFFVVCLLLANGGIFSFMLMFKWPFRASIALAGFMTATVMLFCVLGFARLSLSITSKSVHWKAQRFPLLSPTEWNEPLQSYSAVVIRELSLSAWPASLKPDRFTRLSSDGDYLGPKEIVEVLLYHEGRPEERSVSLGCFLAVEKEGWTKFLRLAAATLDKPIARLKRDWNIEEFSLPE